MPKEIFKIAKKKLEMTFDPGWKFEMRPGGWVIGVCGEKRVRFQAREARGKMSLAIGGRLFLGEILQEGQGAAVTGADSDLVAQFPGKVRKVLVQAGAQVSAGDPLVLVEAMKMEFAVKAPFAGKVRQILVQEGQQLSPGDRFVDLQVDDSIGGEKK